MAKLEEHDKDQSASQGCDHKSLYSLIESSCP
jgi:hypothetical protein